MLHERKAKRPLYLASSATDVVDLDVGIEDLVRRLVENWPYVEEDLAIWLESDGEGGPRLVGALRRPAPGRPPSVVWL
jgi:hypothetical protein